MPIDMKKILMFLLIGLSLSAAGQIQTPRPSSGGSVSSVIGLTTVKVDYWRPKMKGRKIFGEGAGFVTPYGKIWRTGANNGTVISFSDDVKVEGTAVPKGEYLLFTWPGEKEWSISLYKDLSLGGNTDGYDAAKEQLRFKVKPEKLTEKVETFTVAIGDISEDNTTAKVQLAWENTSVKFTVVAEYDSKVMQAIAANTDPENYIAAARYYLDNKKDLKQALKWTNEYLAIDKHANEFGTIYFKATLQKAMGDKAGALATSQKSLELAKKGPDGAFYITQNEELIKTLK
jgi:Protein of unknown function (DUF2911)